jgi:hypothetical protein
MMALILCTQGVLAFSSQYLENDTLEVLKGHDSKFRILLQNPDQKARNFAIEVTGDVATLSEQGPFELQPGTNREIFILIQPPKEAEVGAEFHVNYAVGESTSDSEEKGAVVNLGSKISKKFDVLIVSQNPPEFENETDIVETYIFQKVEYDVQCIDKDGDPLTYETSNKAFIIDENGILTFTPLWFQTVKTTITCSDGVDSVEKEVIIKVKGLPIALLLLAGGVGIYYYRKKKKEEEEHNETEEQQEEFIEE